MLYIFAFFSFYFLFGNSSKQDVGVKLLRSELKLFQING